MTTMASDNGSSSSSEPEDEPATQAAHESDTTPSSNSDNGLGDANPESRDTSPDEEPPAAVTMTARAYQLEMLEKSLEKNIIVAVCPASCLVSMPPADLLPSQMDTGSGKTQVFVWNNSLLVRTMLTLPSAILRIQKELERRDKVGQTRHISPRQTTDNRTRSLGSWPRLSPWPTSSLRPSEPRTQGFSPS